MCGKGRISWAIWGLAAGALLVASAAAAQVAPGADAAGAVAKPVAAKPTPAATPAPVKAKAKVKKEAPPPSKVDVVVTNKRTVALTALLVSGAGSADSNKVAGALEAGKKTVIHLSRGKDCLFDVRGLYADGSSTEADSVDLCKDKTINLVD
jgi:hypothetical protein